jgi:rhodanese-related sulfurtransferase
MTVSYQPTDQAALDPAAVRALTAANPDVLLVDVRTPGEYQTAHVPGSVNLPLDQVDAHLRRIVSDAGGRMVLVCQAGGRARQAQQRLTAAGLTDVAILAGGMNAWIAAGGPVERSGRTRWSLERQVRLVAGGIVLVSVLASIWVPAMAYLAGLVGAGLFVAALTNSCLLGMLLARLPYNRGPAADVDAAIARLADPQRAASR